MKPYPSKKNAQIALSLVALVGVQELAMAAQVTIDFGVLDWLATGQSVRIGPTFDEDGFRVSGSSLAYFTSSSDESIGSSPSLFENTFDGQVTLTQLNGNPFSIYSIDLAEFGQNYTPTVTFTGARVDGSIVMDSFILDGSFPQFSLDGRSETFQFSSEFTNLVSVSWNQGAQAPLNSPRNFHQFDNIVVEAVATSAVPLPAASWMLLSGMMGCMPFLRRRIKHRGVA